MKIVLLLLAIFMISVLASPESPVWPEKFTEDFEEEFDYPVIGKYTTTGSFYYDAVTHRYMVHRENGRGDRYCGINGFKVFKNTPCNQFVDELGDRYLHYPELDECCYCCSAEHGCGILRQDWLSGAEFQGEVDYKGYTAYKWDKAGLQSNFYYETIAESPQNRIMLDMDQTPNDDQSFDPSTWSLTFDDSILDLPGICKKEKTCALASTCTAVRKS